MAGAEHWLRDLPTRLGADVRVVRAPCMGACDRAPVCAVDPVQVMRASAPSVAVAVSERAHAHAYPAGANLDAYRREHGYRQLQACLDGTQTREAVIAAVSDAGLRGLGGAGFPTRRKRALVRGPGAARP